MMLIIDGHHDSLREREQAVIEIGHGFISEDGVDLSGPARPSVGVVKEGRVHSQSLCSYESILLTWIPQRRWRDPGRI